MNLLITVMLDVTMQMVSQLSLHVVTETDSTDVFHIIILMMDGIFMLSQYQVRQVL